MKIGFKEFIDLAKANKGDAFKTVALMVVFVGFNFFAGKFNAESESGYYDMIPEILLGFAILVEFYLFFKLGNIDNKVNKLQSDSESDRKTIEETKDTVKEVQKDFGQLRTHFLDIDKRLADAEIKTNSVNSKLDVVIKLQTEMKSEQKTTRLATRLNDFITRFNNDVNNIVKNVIDSETDNTTVDTIKNTKRQYCVFVEQVMQLYYFRDREKGYAFLFDKEDAMKEFNGLVGQDVVNGFYPQVQAMLTKIAVLSTGTEQDRTEVVLRHEMLNTLSNFCIHIRHNR